MSQIEHSGLRDRGNFSRLIRQTSSAQAIYIALEMGRDRVVVVKPSDEPEGKIWFSFE